MRLRPPQSLRRYLLAWIVAPIALFVVVDTVSLYRRALQSINLAYDRSLLASARSIGELLQLQGSELKVEVPYAALEIFEASNKARMYYRIDGFEGQFLSGFEDLPRYRGRIPQQTAYPALVDFYDVQFRGETVRMAALYQPVASAEARGMALVQVAETLEVREKLAREILLDTLLRQALLITVVALVTWTVVTRALRPVESLRRQLLSRSAEDLSPLQAGAAPRELRPMVTALNDLMQRLQRLVGHQLRFVRDASHQLRTPLAVLKIQVQNGQSGHAGGAETLQAIGQTVDRAIALANQMLALAKVEQVHGEGQSEPLDLAEVVSEVALELSPLIAEKQLDFELDARPATVQAHHWMLRELSRNLLHNAIRESPPGGMLQVVVAAGASTVRLLVRDSGPGIGAAQREHLFEPFHTAHPNSGSGLGLTICREICQALGARIELLNRSEQGRVAGLDAVVVFPGGATATRVPGSQ
ncbi:sensor histidine kinase N-terminal domain-containing protein [Aquabacterium sp. A7-Y]|uniref:sensor histidine kinase n=1 Tax=Aquabacterium sp. A7-Y TaxID=1349605 RepID=UPI00223D35D1|nr:sensor histidine kinase [Aquabacterium sp. A7-Y]MCW7537747.1 sensor histidine kinase N-terminal domain-containing protein [Aquabacterium sp. A7-Y]